MSEFENGIVEYNRKLSDWLALKNQEQFERLFLMGVG